jgi:hypothetical protein
MLRSSERSLLFWSPTHIHFMLLNPITLKTFDEKVQITKLHIMQLFSVSCYLLRIFPTAPFPKHSQYVAFT